MRKIRKPILIYKPAEGDVEDVKVKGKKTVISIVPNGNVVVAPVDGWIVSFSGKLCKVKLITLDGIEISVTVKENQNVNGSMKARQYLKVGAKARQGEELFSFSYLNDINYSRVTVLLALEDTMGKVFEMEVDTEIVGTLL